MRGLGRRKEEVENVIISKRKRTELSQCKGTIYTQGETMTLETGVLRRDRAVAAEHMHVLKHGWNSLLPPGNLYPWVQGRQHYLSEGCQHLGNTSHECHYF